MQHFVMLQKPRPWSSTSASLRSAVSYGCMSSSAYRMKQVDVERSQEFRKCIECFLCQNTCHVVRDHEENKPAFAGPRYFIRAAELDMHPLDDRGDRKEYAQASQGLGYCNITKCCTEVCPEHIKITDNAIIPLKERVADEYYDPFRVLWRKLRGEREAQAGAEGDGAGLGDSVPAGADSEGGPARRAGRSGGRRRVPSSG